MTVAVLFARADSVYKSLRGCDVWDIDRDARKWGGRCTGGRASTLPCVGTVAIVGCEPRQLPPVQMQLLEPTHVVCPAHGMRAGHPRWRPIITKRERESTPEPMARFLVAIAKRCRVVH